MVLYDVVHIIKGCIMSNVGESLELACSKTHEHILRVPHIILFLRRRRCRRLLLFFFFF